MNSKNISSSRTFHFAKGETLLIDKPTDWTSFDIVNKIRWTIRIKKVGHAGTLDPMATGLLIVCTGKNTKKLNEFQYFDKKYEGTMILGKTTPSFDSETEPDSETDISHLTKTMLEAVLPQFRGQISQIPPAYSAVKIKGKPAYLAARKGEKVKLKPRDIEIKSLEITKINFPEVQFRVHCSKGTYIRSLVRDIGKVLGVGAYLSGLRRTHIGEFSVTEAFSIQSFVELARQQMTEAEQNQKLS